MYSIYLLVVDDEHEEVISRQLAEQLEAWIWIRRGLFTLHSQRLTSYADWKACVAHLRSRQEPFSIFTTIDLEIPERKGGESAVRYGEAIVRECQESQDQPALHHIVITKHHDTDAGKRLSERFPHVNIVLNDPMRPIPSLVCQEIQRAVFRDVPWLALEENAADLDDVIHFGGSKRLKEAFWKVEEIAVHTASAPILLYAEEHSWGYPFARLLAQLTDREPREVSLNANNWKAFRDDLQRWKERGYYRDPKEIVYLNGLEHWRGQLSEANTASLFGELTCLVHHLWGRPTGESAPSVLVVRFPDIEPVQFYNYLHPAATQLHAALSRAIAGNDDHSASTSSLSHNLRFPRLSELKPSFVPRLMEDELRRRRLLSGHRDLDLDTKVRRFLELHQWHNDTASPGIRGFQRVLENAFTHLAAEATGRVLAPRHFPGYEKEIRDHYDLLGEIKETYEWLKRTASDGCKPEPGRSECMQCINTDPACHLEKIVELRDRTKQAVTRARDAHIHLQNDHAMKNKLQVLTKIDRFLDSLFGTGSDGITELKTYAESYRHSTRQGAPPPPYPRPGRQNVHGVAFDWPVSHMQLHQCLAHYLEQSRRKLVLSTVAFDFLASNRNLYNQYNSILQEAQELAEIELHAHRSYPTPIAEAIDLVLTSKDDNSREAVSSRWMEISTTFDIMLRYATTLLITEYRHLPANERRPLNQLCLLRKRLDYNDWKTWFEALAGLSGGKALARRNNERKRVDTSFIDQAIEKLCAAAGTQVDQKLARIVGLFQAQRSFRNERTKWRPQTDPHLNDVVWLAVLDLLLHWSLLDKFELVYILHSEDQVTSVPKCSYKIRVLAGLGGRIEEHVEGPSDLKEAALYIRPKDHAKRTLWPVPPHMLWNEEEKNCRFLMGVYHTKPDELIEGEENAPTVGQEAAHYRAFWRSGKETHGSEDIDQFISELKRS